MQSLRSKTIIASTTLALLVMSAPAVLAHHEAIFGPQSTLVMSSPSYVSFQTYVRRTGALGTRERETTALVSASISPFRIAPISITAIVPASRITDLESGKSFVGREDMIFGLRYHLNFSSLNERFGKQGNFAMVMGAAEMPSGNVDNRPFDAPIDYMVAGLSSIEKGSISGVAYTFGRMNGTYRGEKDGNDLFVGGGLAWTPFDNPSTERLLSFQGGISHEIYFRDTANRTVDVQSGGWGTLLHPTVVWGPGGHILLFGTTSLPIAQSYRDRASEDRWRFGFGVTWLLGE